MNLPRWQFPDLSRFHAERSVFPFLPYPRGTSPPSPMPWWADRTHGRAPHYLSAHMSPFRLIFSVRARPVADIWPVRVSGVPSARTPHRGSQIPRWKRPHLPVPLFCLFWNPPPSVRVQQSVCDCLWLRRPVLFHCNTPRCSAHGQYWRHKQSPSSRPHTPERSGITVRCLCGDSVHHSSPLSGNHRRHRVFPASLSTVAPCCLHVSRHNQMTTATLSL